MSEQHWKTDTPTTDDEAVELLRFGIVQTPIEQFTSVNAGEFDRVRTERRMLNCAAYAERELAAARQRIAEQERDYGLLNLCLEQRQNQIKVADEYIATLEANAKELTARLEAAERDGARLAFAENKRATIYAAYDNGKLLHWVFVDETKPGDRRGVLGKTIRTAIDAALLRQTTEGTDGLIERANNIPADDVREYGKQIALLWGETAELCRAYERRWKDAEQRIKVVEAELAERNAFGNWKMPDALPEYFAKDGIVEGIAKHHPTALVRQMANEILRIRALSPKVEPLTLASCPIGTEAPAVGGGCWTKTKRGWQWGFSGGTFPTPGGDWNGELIAPRTERRKGERRDNHPSFCAPDHRSGTDRRQS